MGVLRLRGDLIPAINNTCSIGTSTVRFKDVFVGPGTINILDNVTNVSSNITVSNGVFQINNVAQAQLPNVTVTNLTFSDHSVQTSANNFSNISVTNLVASSNISASNISVTNLTFSDGTLRS